MSKGIEASFQWLPMVKLWHNLSIKINDSIDHNQLNKIVIHESTLMYVSE